MNETTAKLDQLIGARLRLARQLRGVTQSELAEHLGITFQQVQKYEHATNRISASTLFVCAQKLDVPVTYFFDLPDREGSPLLEDALNDPSGADLNFFREYQALDPAIKRGLRFLTSQITQGG